MEKHINHFLKFAAKELKLSKMPKISLVGHSEDKKRTFGDYDQESIRVRATGRHPIDVMRTLAHELIHRKQKGSLISNQAKEDQANAIAGRMMRKYDEQNPQVFKEDATAASVVPANAVGAQGINADSTGPIQGFSPMLGGKKKDEKRGLLSRIAPSASLSNKAGDKGRSLRDIIGKNKAEKDMKKEKKFINPFGV
jgi:hypothetical protein